MLEDDKPTDDQFRVDVTGDRRHENGVTHGNPLVILEDLNPDFFSNPATEGVFDAHGQMGDEEIADAREEFGADVREFLKDLARACNSLGFVVIVTTMYPRVAKFLHKDINGGEKFQISESLMCKQYNGMDFLYSARIFHFENHFVGLWTDASKMEMLLQMFPDCSAEDVKALMRELPKASIRSYCHILSRRRAKMSSRNRSASQHSVCHDDPEKKAASCCSILPDSFLGIQN
ncbi:MAG: hypothetical protein SGILL_010803 [Bacillariaceae sp.]